jgi:HlyD family secretion protein
MKKRAPKTKPRPRSRADQPRPVAVAKPSQPGQKPAAAAKPSKPGEEPVAADFGDAPAPANAGGAPAPAKPGDAAAAPKPGAPAMAAKPGAVAPTAGAAAPAPAGAGPDEASKPPAEWHNKVIIGLALAGILAGLAAAYVLGRKNPVEPPVFKPVSNPYASAIHANGIIESDQGSGANIAIYPEISGPVTAVLVAEGQAVAAGAPLFSVDDTLQRAATEVAESNLKAALDQYGKRRAAFDLDPQSVSRDVLDTAKDAYLQAAASLKAANALLLKYRVLAPVAGVVLAVNAAVGAYASPLGSYDAYTQGADPLVVMGGPQDSLEVRCYVDEILVSRLPAGSKINAQMSIRGSDVKVPLDFVRIQPYVSPKIELSNERQEQVDLRVLPVIFRFHKNGAAVYPGQLVDVFIQQPPADGAGGADAGADAGAAP